MPKVELVELVLSYRIHRQTHNYTDTYSGGQTNTQTATIISDHFQTEAMTYTCIHDMAALAIIFIFYLNWHKKGKIIGIKMVCPAHVFARNRPYVA